MLRRGMRSVYLVGQCIGKADISPRQSGGSGILGMRRLGTTSGLSKITGSKPMNQSQISSALRPFYLAVHPDLFGQHPVLRTVNEDSLKLLNGFLDFLQQSNALHNHPNLNRDNKPIILTFYMKNKQKDSSGFTIKKIDPFLIENGISTEDFRAVHVKLVHKEPMSLILAILKACNFPHSHLEKSGEMDWASLYSQYRSDVDYDDDHDVTFHEEDFLNNRTYQRKKKATENAKSNSEFFARIVDEAEQVTEQYSKITTDIQLLQKCLCETFGFSEVSATLHPSKKSWGPSHIRGALLALQRTLGSFGSDRSASTKGTYFDPRLVGHRIQLSTDETHCAAPDCTLMLGMGDVPEIWMALFNKSNQIRQMRTIILTMESNIKRALNGFRITCAANNSAELYCRWLSDLDRSLNDSKLLSSVKNDEFRDLTGIIVDENQCMNLSILDDGLFIIPSGCEASALHIYLSNYAELAREKNRLKLRENESITDLSQKLLDKFHLKSLSWDSSLSYGELKSFFDSCEVFSNLTMLKNQSIRLVRGGHQTITVGTNGELCLPIDYQFN